MTPQNHLLKQTTLAFIAMLFSLTTLAQSPFASPFSSSLPKKPTNPVTVTTAWPATALTPGQTTHLAIVLNIASPFHTNPDQNQLPKDSPLIPVSIEVIDAPANLITSTPIYPPSHTTPFGAEGEQELIPVFSDQTIIYLPMAIPADHPTGPLSLQIKVTYQACDDQVCHQPQYPVLTATIDVTDDATTLQPANAELFADLQLNLDQANILTIDVFGRSFQLDTTSLLLVYLVSALGGFLLNLTPCVLPLIPIKIMGLARSAGSRSKTLFLGGVMSLGVVAFWLALGGAIALVSGFSAANQLFQYPAFTLTVGGVIAIMGLGMIGLFTTSLPQWVYRFNPKHDSLIGSFAFGIMTAILSTPCTAPMMGATAAWSALQPPLVTLSTFAAIGAGMALPYFLLSAFPKIVDRMPKAGPASELIKQVMGLLMIAAALYFLGTGLSGAMNTPPAPPSRLYWWAVALAIALSGIWLAYRTLKLTPAIGKRITFISLGVFFVFSGLFIGQNFTRTSPINWVYYTPDQLTEAQTRGDITVLEFTAEWCLNCKALEESVLHKDAVVKSLNAAGVTPIKIDLTGNNQPGNDKLIEAGRRTIPLLIIYDRAGREVFKSDAYTQSQVLEAIQKAQAK